MGNKTQRAYKNIRNPLSQGKWGLNGIIPEYSGKSMRGYTSSYRNIKGILVRKYFSRAEFGTKKETLRKAELFRLKGLTIFHGDALRITMLARKNRGDDI